MSLAQKIAVLFLVPEVFRECQTAYQRKHSPKEVAFLCLEERHEIDSLLFWDGVVRVLAKHGVEIRRERFSEYKHNNGAGVELFKEVFQRMISPPSPKPLSEWM